MPIMWSRTGTLPSSLPPLRCNNCLSSVAASLQHDMQLTENCLHNSRFSKLLIKTTASSLTMRFNFEIINSFQIQIQFQFRLKDDQKVNDFHFRSTYIHRSTCRMSSKRGKGGKFKKNRKSTKLSKEDIEFLVARYDVIFITVLIH